MIKNEVLRQVEQQKIFLGKSEILPNFVWELSNQKVFLSSHFERLMEPSVNYDNKEKQLT